MAAMTNTAKHTKQRDVEKSINRLNWRDTARRTPMTLETRQPQITPERNLWTFTKKYLTEMLDKLTILCYTEYKHSSN